MNKCVYAIVLASMLQLADLGQAVSQHASSAKSIIAEHCIECHRVPGFFEKARNPNLAAPDFQSIADDPKTYTTQRLFEFLRQPHFPMRRITLSEGDIYSIIGFIRELGQGRRRID